MRSRRPRGQLVAISWSVSHSRPTLAALAGEEWSRCSVIGASKASGDRGPPARMFGRLLTAAAERASSATKSGASASRQAAGFLGIGQVGCRLYPPFRSGLGGSTEPFEQA